MIFLFIGMAAGGIFSRLTLLSARGGWFHQENASKPMTQVIFELLGTVAGLAAFVAAFTFLDWWVPILALAIGYWVIPVLIINKQTFGAIYSLRFMLTLVSLSCSAFILFIAIN